MSIKKSVVCDGCHAAIAPGASLLSVFVERDEAPSLEPRNKQRRTDPRPYAELDLCVACACSSVNLAALFETHAVTPRRRGED